MNWVPFFSLKQIYIICQLDLSALWDSDLALFLLPIVLSKLSQVFPADSIT